MQHSIKRFMTINALCMIALATLLAIIAAFFLRQDQIKQHLDAELAIEAHSIYAFINDRLSPRQINRIQKKINHIPTAPSSAHLNQTAPHKKAKKLAQNIEFQVWDLQNKRLILASPNAPALTLNKQLGYSTQSFRHQVWTTYAITAESSGYKIVTMQRLDQRLGYAQQFVTDTIAVISITFMFLGITIQLIIQKGLGALEMTTRKLRKHAPHNLAPLKIDDTPIEIKPLVAEINRLMHQLNATLERERQFAANAAHTLKTPLAAMKAQLQMASRLPSDNRQQVFEDLTHCIDRYDHIIKQLLTLSSISANTHTQLSDTAIDTDLQHIIAPLVPLALHRSIELELETPQLPKIKTDPSLLTIALTNLIDNAIQYTQAGDTVLIKALLMDPFIIIHIIDHGPGIPDDQMPAVLERFKRLSANTRGSGLGLNIVKEICNHLNIKLSLSHTHPHGLTISLTIPINHEGSTQC